MTQFNAPTYDIERSSGQCAFTGKIMQPGEPYMAVLVEIDPAEVAAQAGEKEPAKGKTSKSGAQQAAMVLGFKRLDVSMQAWEANQRPPRMFGYWKSTVAAPNQKKKLFVDDEILFNLFVRLGEGENTQRQGFRFVLGLILMRKKLLKYEGSFQKTDESGQLREWWRLIGRGTQGPVLEMMNPQMDEAMVNQVKDQLAEVLAAEL